MPAPDPLLSLRPSNAVARLGPGSKLPLLNPRDLLAAQEGRSEALVMAPLLAPFLLEGTLRAARDRDAAVGIIVPLAERQYAARHFEAIRRVTDALSHRKPLFLVAGPLRPEGTDERSIGADVERAFAAVDAGFTALWLDLQWVAPEDAASLLRQVAQPAQERELSIFLTPPVGDALSFVRELGRGFAPRVLCLSAEAALSGEVTVPRGGELALSAPWYSGGSASLLEAGVRVFDASAALFARAIAALNPELREELARDPLGHTAQPLSAALEGLQPSSRDKLEALTYGAMFSLLQESGSRGSATRAAVYLSQHAGY